MTDSKDFSVYLRAFEPDDYLQINKWRNDVNLQRLTCGPIRYVSTEMEKAWAHDKMMNNRSDIYLAVCANDGTGKMIGYISLNDIDYVNRNVCGGGIVIGDDTYRDGQALVESFYMILDYAFNELNMHRFYGKYLTTHAMTKSLNESFYISDEGTDKEAVFKCGRYHDVNRCAILRKDFIRHQEAGDYKIHSIIKRMVAAVKRNKRMSSDKHDVGL